MFERLEPLIVKTALGEQALLQFQKGDIAKKHLEPFIQELKKLSEAYNFPERKLETILSSEKTIQAYMLYFLPINLFKIMNLFEKIDFSKDNLKVLDFGCGPGSGALASATILKNPEIYLHDIALEASSLAKDLLSEYSSGVKVQIVDKDFYTRKYDLIIAANSLNEIPINQLPDIIQNLINSLEKEGVLFLLEPALKGKTRQAMGLRNRILEFDQMKTVFPCTHNQECPMLIDSDEDWCHGSLSWQGTKLVRQIDELTGFNKHRLKYSAFIFKKAEVVQSGYRVVSIPKKDKTGISKRLCGKDFYQVVKLSKRSRSESTKEFEKAELHDFVSSLP